MEAKIAELESRLDSFDRAERDQTLDDLLKMVKAGRIALPEPQAKVNLHAHSFYSFNAEGYSPTRIVWRARREGLRAVGLVDFDVFDGIDEFFRAGELLGIPTVGGMETRAYIPEFSTREISSPGEPGITYHMVTGVTGSAIENPEAARFAEMLRTNARNRNIAVVELVNPFLDPVALDYAEDVLPLSPSGTPTERHLCYAYEKKAEQVFPKMEDRVRFWAGKLGQPADKMAATVADSRSLQALIRSKTMKSGGVGYQTPTAESFPLMSDMNRFALSMGSIPTMTWLDGTSQGEQDIEELLDLQIAAGSAAMNIIPDRNWNLKDAAVRKTKVANLYWAVELAGQRDLPLVVGTELNAPGLKFVDDFDAADLAPVVEAFLFGADVLVGHTASVLAGDGGYLDEAVVARFKTTADRNAHFAEYGRSWRR
ncbi:MAG: hypothetical protein JXL80_10705 [Planctomycetes bacterium]|nr:hypothetical protein [Planctomycetota bacterium]